MIRHWFQTGRNRSVRSYRRRHDSIDRNKRAGVFFEQLEERRLLAFVGFTNGTVLTLTQSIDDGDILIDNIGAGDAFRATDLSGTVTFIAATNLTVDLLDGTTNQLDLALDNAHTGNVELNLGDGMRLVNFTGTGNAIGGDLIVNSGTGDQDIDLSDNANLAITGAADFDLGLGSDSVLTSGNDLSVTSDLGLIGVNSFGGSDAIDIGGSVDMSVVGDDSGGRLDPAGGGSTAIGGNLTYTGNGFNDDVFMEDTFSVVGNVVVDMGDGTNLADFDDFGGTTASVGGTVDITGGAGNDTMSTNAAFSSFGGDFTVDFGDGANNADFLGMFNGSNVDYTSGSGVDTVTYDFTGNPADVVVTLGDGVDNFTLGSNASIAPTTLSVDFGDNIDTFTNNFGAFTFDGSSLGLQ